MRAVAYIRVSTRRQANEGVSLDVQRDRISDFVAGNGWTLYETYIDRGASARDGGRPEFQRMLSDAAARPSPFDVIVVYDRSRFYRNAAQAETTIRDLRRNAVQVYSVTQPNGSDEASDMIRQIIAVVDENASRENAKRVRATMCENATQGFWNGAVPPYGFTTTIVERRGKKEKKKLVIDEVESDVVERIFRLAEEGHERSGPMGVKAIVNHLNERGYRTRRDKRWHIGPLHAMLTNTAYRGEYRYNTTDSNTGLPRPEHEHIKVACPAIIEARQFEAVQALLRSRNPKIAAPQVVAGPILLTGLLSCAKCESALTMRTGKSGQYRYYACANRQARGATACAGCSHRMEKIDHAVTEALVTHAFQPDRLANILESIETERLTREADSTELLRFETELADARMRVDRLMGLAERGIADLDDPEFAERMRSAQRDRNIALAGVDRIRRRIGSQVEITPERVVAFANFMRDRIRNGDVPFRKSYLRSVVDRVIVDDERLIITGWKNVLREQVMIDDRKDTKVPIGIQEWRTRQDSNL
ncbi:recombinase family protein [Aureimonas sp. AU22]|uniref:recombinase family protein n=1 Tax=Aureimonas sp. AU22 TaxID=1638162 RepID=UPI0009EAA37A|nr:recombinase family protein [Aureimonas sp. AU22]